ncbi:MAG: hypothetical protein R2867_46855 [Caldilineaceae bacterium]
MRLSARADQSLELCLDLPQLCSWHGCRSGKELALAKRFKEYPTGLPPRQYQWVESAIMSEILWTPADEQKQQVRPDTIPVYADSE